MELKASERESIIERMRQGELTAAEANVEMVRAQRVRLVTRRIPADVRRALSGAVKTGRLGHKKKEGMRPEAYFHPDFAYLVSGERNRHAREQMEVMRNALTAVMARPDDFGT